MILLKEWYNTIPVLELLVIARYKGNYMTGRGQIPVWLLRRGLRDSPEVWEVRDVGKRNFNKDKFVYI